MFVIGTHIILMLKAIDDAGHAYTRKDERQRDAKHRAEPKWRKLNQASHRHHAIELAGSAQVSRIVVFSLRGASRSSLSQPGQSGEWAVGHVLLRLTRSGISDLLSGMGNAISPRGDRLKNRVLLLGRTHHACFEHDLIG